MQQWWTFTNDKHDATWSARVQNAGENSIGEPLDVMLDGWMTAFKRVSVPHRQLGANLIDTHKTLASCARGNCRHDSLSLSMKTAGFCKRHTFFFNGPPRLESHSTFLCLFVSVWLFCPQGQSFYFNELTIFKHAETATSMESRVAGADWEL